MWNKMFWKFCIQFLAFKKERCSIVDWMTNPRAISIGGPIQCCTCSTKILPLTTCSTYAGKCRTIKLQNQKYVGGISRGDVVSQEEKYRKWCCQSSSITVLLRQKFLINNQGLIWIKTGSYQENCLVLW